MSSSDNPNPLFDYQNTESEFANEILNAVESNQNTQQKSANPLYDFIDNEEIDDEALFPPSPTKSQSPEKSPSKSPPPSNPLYEYAENQGDDSSTQRYEAEEEESYITETSNITEDGGHQVNREETSYDYSNNGEALDDSYQQEQYQEEVPENRYSGGNWEGGETVTTETFSSSSTGPEGEVITETVVTRTSKSRSRSPEIVETRSSELVYTPEDEAEDEHIYTQEDNVDDEPDEFEQQQTTTAYEEYEEPEEETKDTKTQVQDGGRTITTTTTKTVTESKGDPKGGSSSMKVKQETSTITSPKTTSVQQNGVDSRVTTQTTREEVRQTEISKNMANMAAPAAGFDDDDEDDEGVYENVPSAPRTDVFRETDAKVDVELPQSGRASNMRERFLKLAGESAAGARTADRELTPPPTVKGKVEAGVFESQPSPKRTDVYRQETRQEVVLPEKGKALNTVQKYKEIASKEFKGPANKREITPDRSGVVEYVSEPRAEHMTYEEKPLEAGIFESKPTVIENVSRYEDYVPDARPQSGTAKSIASKYKEIERNAALPQAAANRREITPDKSGPNEFVSEPRGQHITYEEKVEAGIYENEPAPVRQDIYRHEEYYVEEPLPEKGYAKNLAARFREIEQKAAIPRTSGHRVSPPKDDNRNVYENEPTASPVTYKEAVVQPDVVPEKGLAKNLASRYKKIEEENLKARSGNRQVKEFTPPKDERTVFESAPTPSRLQYEEIVPESGILESQPTVRDDVYRYTDAKDIEVELPERGAAKNLLSKWKQIESESAKGSPPTPGRVKEFTPPREEERIKQLRSPKTPPSGQNNSVHPNDLPGQYHPINEPTVFESKPTPQREDLYREADTDWTVGLPKANKTKKVLAKFQAIQAQTTSSSPVSRKAHDDMDIPTPVRENKSPTTSPRPIEKEHKLVPKKAGHFVAVQNEKCGACQKTVYAMEKVEMNKNAYHRACFKCSQCRAVLTPKTFAINAGTMFCTSHYKQLFARKGNYDEGFGRPQHKKKWKSESNLLDGELHEMEHEIEA
ncbi:uncharacterized protein LOC126824910 isoform X9 [Patella vulgata]|nr:uncharacterized protein LOC126824910 isoform X9 [Patella vulgata]XP_055957756.1 uncharacterized protein LOC126824910 isoform X9 [Patella vulgata]XP_055957757.1 uncharacterized protein LOC126824910 isoform X9 [Patella vulgata]